MVDVNRCLFRYHEGEWVQANDGRVGFVQERQAGFVYRLRCGLGEFFYAESQLRPLGRPGRPAVEGVGATERTGRGASPSA
jgi:hypothetical protein